MTEAELKIAAQECILRSELEEERRAKSIQTIKAIENRMTEGIAATAARLRETGADPSEKEVGDAFMAEHPELAEELGQALMREQVAEGVYAFLLKLASSE